MFLLALTAGLRQGELIALKWSDLDEEQGKRSEYRGTETSGKYAGRSAEILNANHAKAPLTRWAAIFKEKAGKKFCKSRAKRSKSS